MHYDAAISVVTKTLDVETEAKTEAAGFETEPEAEAVASEIEVGALCLLCVTVHYVTPPPPHRSPGTTRCNRITSRAFSTFPLVVSRYQLPFGVPSRSPRSFHA